MAGNKSRLFVVLLLALLLAGCSRKDTADSESSGYSVYYTNLEGTRLISRAFTPVSERFDGILEEMLKEFQHPSSTDLASAMPLGVEINGYTMGVDDLKVDFNAAYLGISNIQEVLLRSGIVKTLLQLPGVTRVMITVDGQSLTDNNGMEVGYMDESSFIDKQGDSINSYHYITLNLYFGNVVGDRVVKEVRNVYYSSNLITEKVIVEQILKGPVNARLQAVAQPTVQVKSVQIQDDICVIDLDESFNTAPPGSTVSPKACLYAFVNAICEACEVDGVQFRINGESDVRFRGEVNLEQVFSWDETMIEASGLAQPLAGIYVGENGSSIDIDSGQEKWDQPEGEKTVPASESESSTSEGQE